MPLSRWRGSVQHLFSCFSPSFHSKGRSRSRTFKPFLESLEDRCVPTIAYDVPAGTVGNQAYGGSLGLDFNVNAPILIDQLGAFNDASAGAGLTTPITVRLWDRTTQNEVGSPITFPAGTPGTLINGSRFLPLATPIWLPAGFQGTIVAEGYGSGVPVEQNGNNVAPTSIENSGGGLISFVGTGRFGNAGDYPTNIDGGPSNRYYAGTFDFVAASAAPPPLPAPSAAITSLVPEAANYGVVYDHQIPNNANFDTNGVPYNQNTAPSVIQPFDRIAYLLQLQQAAGPLQYAWVSMNAYTANANLIGVPSLGTGAFWHYPNGSLNDANITNMNVFSNVPGVVTGTGIATGNIEFWPSNYGQNNDYGVPGANNGTYDFGDGGAGVGNGYGSLQVNNYGAAQTILAYNQWGSGAGEAGIGNQVGGSGNPDWTFASNISGYTVKELTVFVEYQADLAVSKTDPDTSLAPGSTTTYTVTVTDNGPRNVYGAAVSDVLPAGISSATWTAVTSGGSSFGNGATSLNGSGNINTLVNLLNGGSAVFTVLATISPSFSGQLSNTANVSLPSGYFDPNLGNNTSTYTLTVLQARGNPIIAVGTDIGAGPEVKVFDARTGAIKFDFYAYSPLFTGGVRVAVGDINGDGVPDIITGPGPGMAPEVKVFNGRTGALIRDFYAYTPLFTGGIFVAAGDLNGDGFDDIVVGPDAGFLPEVKAFSGRTAALLVDFFAFNPFFTGGVRVGAGDVNGDGLADIITGLGVGGLPEVRVFSRGIKVQDFFAFDPSNFDGVYVGAGYFTPNGQASVIAGSGAGAPPAVREQNNIFYAYPYGFTGGVRVGSIADLNNNGVAEVLTGGGTPPPPAGLQQDPGVTGNFPFTGPVPAQVIEGLSLTALDSFFAFAPYYFGGIFIAGSR